ncbi:hypothetical protein [Arthrobacter sp. NicSoilB8]|uniref:hypothetical protein n=1 Tax=Arthrobacter sp. NicSoilB8 TaxID=2830998 RepID=UPI001CC7FE3A|nr:hypothetical protein [Arthrobacter sp. NicSoilB8]
MTTEQVSPTAIRITALDAESVQESINEAVGLLILAALERPSSGILLTRHDHSTYTAELSSDVPYGQTLEVRSDGVHLPESPLLRAAV